ncbi:MAG: hypothetical protein ACO2PM_12915 [Pyrobaculum sp.]
MPRLRVTNSYLLSGPMPHTSIVFFLIKPICIYRQAGKTTFIDNALGNLGNTLPSRTVVVRNVTDGYEGYADYQAPYPLSAVRELNPVILPRVLGEVFRIDSDENAITPTMAQSLRRWPPGSSAWNLLLRFSMLLSTRRTWV